MPRMLHRHAFRVIAGVLVFLTLLSLVLLIGAIRCRTWDAATTYATLLVGFIAAEVVVWQGTLIKGQLAISLPPILIPVRVRKIGLRSYEENSGHATPEYE